MLFVQKCFFVETISFDIQITHDFMAFNGHSFFYHINILLLIDAVDNRNKTKPRKFLVYRDIAIIDINSKTTKIFDGILSDQKGGKYRWIQFLLDTAVYHYLRNRFRVAYNNAILTNMLTKTLCCYLCRIESELCKFDVSWA